jgi:hypothetical protein
MGRGNSPRWPRSPARRADDLLQDAMVGHFDELMQAREMLNSRYTDLKSGRVKPIDGEEAFERLCRREDKLLTNQSAE